MQASPPTQDEDQAQVDENEDQEDEPPQEEDNDQGGDGNDKDKENDQEIQVQRPPHPRVHQAIQRDHPVNSILGDIHKGVATRSRVAHFCEHYSFVSSIEPYRIEDALRGLDWVLAMQDDLNFTRNEVWHLVPRPTQNVVGTCRGFEPRGSLDRRVNCRRVPQPRWVGARRSAKGGRSRRETCVKGETRGLRVCPAPRSGALAVGGYKRPRGRERAAYASAVPFFPARPTLCKRALDLPFIGVRKGSRCTMGDVAVC
jgi:hypothetical protein